VARRIDESSTNFYINFNMIRPAHCDYNHPRISTDANNLYAITKSPIHMNCPTRFSDKSPSFCIHVSPDDVDISLKHVEESTSIDDC
jgi:hypothetical protein